MMVERRVEPRCSVDGAKEVIWVELSCEEGRAKERYGWSEGVVKMTLGYFI